MSVSQSEADKFFDGDIDWEGKIAQKDALIMKTEENTRRLKKDIIAMKEVLKKKDSEIRKLERKAYEIEREYDDSRERYARDRKRLQWFERREDDESSRQMEKKMKLDRERRIIEEVKLKVRVEEKERETIRNEKTKSRNSFNLSKINYC